MKNKNLNSIDFLIRTQTGKLSTKLTTCHWIYQPEKVFAPKVRSRQKES